MTIYILYLIIGLVFAALIHAFDDDWPFTILVLVGWPFVLAALVFGLFCIALTIVIETLASLFKWLAGWK
jgi:hypothetical protein